MDTCIPWVDGFSKDPRVWGVTDVTKKCLSSNFEMKDMGEASYVLGVKILRDHSKCLLGLSQEMYIKKMLQRYHMHDCQPMDTLVERI